MSTRALNSSEGDEKVMVVGNEVDESALAGLIFMISDGPLCY